MANYYLAVCTNGHLIDSEKAEDVSVQQIKIDEPVTSQQVINPDYAAPYAYCPNCGGEVRTTCPDCHHHIQTEYNGPPYPGKDSIPSYCHGCGESHPWTSTVEAQKQRDGDFIDIDDSKIDGQFYPALVYEINLCYKTKADHAVLVLNRKLIESLTIDILRATNGMEAVDLWFDTENSITLPLSTLIENLKSQREEIKKYGPTLDEAFFRAVEKLKYRGDASAHSVEEHPLRGDLKEQSELATTVAKILFRLRTEAKTAHRK
ncbi:DUF2321 domain-containing protein [Halorussus gelatinilyticus]|uniref:DUF2321 domain-containing protein n=1 Tax=Halorussus gelatinilyticus TaxID=2937524 RepID=A0A8U0IHS3_9EURY|nr:DUF2321 domain-containing protein [Halorussus gelatinilyticus]UPW00637.1 DUF2321 domain-containing protein [Halorussus gelatinilyticus]